MAENPRVEQLLDEILNSGRSPEEVCGSCPELLPEVRRRWREMCCVEAELAALFPTTAVAAGPPPNTNPPSIPGYEVEAVLGRGGMGVVYRARHLKLNRPVALKMLLAGDCAGPSDRARFQREAEAVAALRHENIVQVYDVGEQDGRPYFTMEIVQGGSLAEKLAGVPQPAREAAALVVTLAEAVSAAHQGGIVHRDLKPANVLLTADGMPKISDFGLARRVEGGERLTQSGVLLGTPSYMAPEQARGRTQALGPPVDIYALGAILYELLTGRPPFRGETAADTVLQVISQEPVPPSRLNPRVPRDLETICLKCLRKEPARRYPSAEELANDLRRFQAGEPIRARPVGALERTWKWARRRPALATLLGVVLLALVSLAVLSGNLVAARNDADEKRRAAEEKETAARKEADKARKARDFLVSIFELSDARTQTSTLTPRQILDDAEKRIPRDFADQPELRAELQTAIDGVYAKITQNAPLAMLLEVRGSVQLQSTRGPRQQPVPQALLYDGDRLSLADNAQVRLVVLSDLHQERLRPGSEATVRRKGCEPAEAVSERGEDGDKLSTEERADPDLAGLREPGALDQLSAEERDEWLALWKEVGALLKRATSP
jgi:predicted Ser/Thr protein kinase